MAKVKIDAKGLRTWIEVSRTAIKNNYRVFRKLLGPKVKLMAVVKSNAYGHGLVAFAREVTALGVDYLGVDSIVEAVRLRQEGIAVPILVLGYTRPLNFLQARELDIELAISSLDSLEYLVRRQKNFANKKLKIHLKVDTGMHRQGFLPHDFPRALALLKKLEKIVEVVGVFSHLMSSSADKKFNSATAKQIAEFRKFLNQLAGAGFAIEKLLKHSCASGRSFTNPEAHFDLVRIGFSFYGLWPSRELEKKFSAKYSLMPALTWKTILSEVKTLSQDGHIGYDHTEAVKKGTKIGICPIGYWHGFPRALSGIGEVQVRGKKAKVLGRVSMDMIAVDLTKIKGARVGDEVTIIGPDVRARTMAEKTGTSPYEIITRLNPLIKKFYL